MCWSIYKSNSVGYISSRTTKGVKKEDPMTYSPEALKDIEAMLPVATYTCAQCPEEHTDPFWDPTAEQWVCEGCYDHAAAVQGYEGDPLHVSDLKAELTPLEPTTAPPRFAVVTIDHTGQEERAVFSPRPALSLKDICEMYGWDDLFFTREEGDSLRIELEPPAPATDPDFGTPEDGPVWTVVGIYDNGQIGVFHIHAKDSQHALKAQIKAAKEDGTLGDSFDHVAAFPGAHVSAI